LRELCNEKKQVIQLYLRLNTYENTKENSKEHLVAGLAKAEQWKQMSGVAVNFNMLFLGTSILYKQCDTISGKLD
jgi:hypothetical protein